MSLSQKNIKKNTLTKERLVSIDIAKAICIILVVIGHYQPDNAPEWYNTIIRIIYSFHMPLFMFVSGYVYWATKKADSYGSFVWKKFRRLMIPYFFASMIIITIKMAMERGMYVENPVTFSAFYEMFYMPSAGFFLWFAYALFLMFLIIPFFNTPKKLLVLLAGALLLFFLPFELPDVLCLPQFKLNLIYFVLGCALFEWKKLRRTFVNIHLLIVLALFAGFLLIKETGIIESEGIIAAIIFITALLGIGVISGLSQIIEKKSQALSSFFVSLSIYTYTIYLFHTTFEGFTKAVFLKFSFVRFFGEEITFVLSCLVIISAGVILPILLHKIIVRYSRFFSFLIGAK